VQMVQMERRGNMAQAGLSHHRLRYKPPQPKDIPTNSDHPSFSLSPSSRQPLQPCYEQRTPFLSDESFRLVPNETSLCVLESFQSRYSWLLFASRYGMASTRNACANIDPVHDPIIASLTMKTTQVISIDQSKQWRSWSNLKLC